MKIIINCGPCEEWIGRCLSSLRAQRWREWEAFVTIDPCGDRTFQQAVEARRDDRRISIFRNERRQYSMRNLIDGIGRSNAASEDVIVILDGDDWLLHDYALGIIARTYAETGCWLTYGSWVCNDSATPGLWPGYPDDAVDFRSLRWLGTAVRTWKTWLWNRIDAADFRDRRGQCFRVTEDLAAMFPMLEMSTIRRIRHIAEPLLLYNRHQNGVASVMAEEAEENAFWLRSRPRYRAVDGPPAGGTFTNGRAAASLD